MVVNNKQFCERKETNMAKRPRSAKQLANDQRLRDEAAARKAAQNEPTLDQNDLNTKQPQPISIPEEQIVPEQSESDLQRQVNELKAMMFDLTKGSSDQGVKFDRQGGLVGTFEKYTVDPSNYPDPSTRLSQEPRLAPFAFGYNYELKYEVHVSQYDTKDGRNVKEPRFMMELRRIVLDDLGVPTNRRYIVRKLTFHEDPQAAIQIARANNVEVDKENEVDFLNEMRYIRARDWLLDIFYPPKATASKAKREIVVDNQVIEVITLNGEDDQVIPFGELNKKSKLRA